MEADLATLRERVLSATRASPVTDNIADIVLETDRDDEGSSFLRILIQFKDSVKTEDAALENLLESIERSVGDIDERYASVRFADAA